MNDFILIGHYHGKSLWSRFIKLRSWWKSPITHTAALSRDLEFVYEAWWKADCVKTAWEDSNHTLGTRVDVFKIPCTREQADAFYQYLEDTEGAKYDFKAVILGFLSRRDIQSKDKFFCTEWIGNACEAANIYLQARIPTYKLTPSLGYISPIQEPYRCLETP